MAATVRLSQQHSCSFDHLVCAGEHRCRHFEAERPGGLEIEHSFVLGRRLNRQVGRLLALEDTIDVACRAAELVDEIRPVRNQAALGGEVPGIVDPRQSVTSRKSNDRLAMNCRRRASRYDYAAVRTLRECRDAALDLVSIARIDWPQLHAKCWRDGLNCPELGGSSH